jgi:hypothetical protein
MQDGKGDQGKNFSIATKIQTRGVVVNIVRNGGIISPKLPFCGRCCGLDGKETSSKREKTKDEEGRKRSEQRQ